MSGTADRRGKNSEKWIAESEIEACRQELEASFLREKESLEARRAEILDRLDRMEQNTLSEVEEEKTIAETRRNEILSALHDQLDRRYEDFILRLHAEDLIEALAQECMERLLPAPTPKPEGSL
jgi:oligoribonuclease NrnB/cAMP/cGMP phosphodiesterase (DHH superfamily)